MKFTPITKEYAFSDNVLIKTYPQFMHKPLHDWMYTVLKVMGMIIEMQEIIFKIKFANNFVNEINTHFRETFPVKPDYFLDFVLENKDRTTNFLSLCLENYASYEDALILEKILSKSGSAYRVVLTSENPTRFKKGVAKLEERVPEIVRTSFGKVATTNSLLEEAWNACYSTSPNYETAVSRSVDAIEGHLQMKFFPKDLRPNISKFIKDLIANNKFTFKGDNLVLNKNELISIGKEFIAVRGQHQSGTGRIPTKEEAEFILHYTIFILSVSH